SVTPPIGSAFQAFQVAGKDEIKDGIRQYLDNLYQGLSNDSIPSPDGRLVAVFILGRYKIDEFFVPAGWRQRYGDRLEIRFKTIHTSKG
ncbi:hypothetical protein DEM28_26420, partial [Enterobacter mori]